LQFTVSLTNQEAGATYKYTIDGTSPTGASALTLQSTSLNLSLTGTTNPSLIFKAYGIRNDYANSDIITLNYALQNVSDAIFSLASGSVPENQVIGLDLEAGATGYYTLNGVDPSGNAGTTSSQYTNPFVLSFANSSSVTGKAIAVKGGSLDSQIVSGIFTHNSSLDYGGAYDGVRDVEGALVSFKPVVDKVPFPSKVFLSTTEGQEIHRKISFWGTDFYVENYRPSTKDDFISLSAGQNHALALTQSGTVVAWGDSSFGQTNLTNSKLITSGEIERIDAGDSHSLALTFDQEVIAWGSNVQGQTAVPNNLSAIRVAAGGEHSLALKSDRTVVGWGENADGQIILPNNLNDVFEISAGQNHSAALAGYGVKTCKQLQHINGQWSVVNKSIPIGVASAWGVNDLAQSTVPSSLSAGTPDLIAISCGGNHTLALDANGKVFGWGDNGYGQITPLTGMDLVEPDGSSAFAIEIDAGFSHSLAISEKGTVFAWGSNLNNQTNVTNLFNNSVLLAAGDNYSLAYGLEPDEHIYYSTGALDPSILYTGFINVNSNTTINAISQNKSTQAASNLVSKSYSQQQLSGVSDFGLLSSEGTYTPMETGTINPARFTERKDFVTKIHEDDVQKEPEVEITVSHPGYLTYQIEDVPITDAVQKRFSSSLVDGDVGKAFDNDKSINNYLSFNPGGYVGYKFDNQQKVTRVDFATNADNFHKVGDGLIQGANNGIDWEDIAFFSKRFPDSYPPFLSLDGNALDRIATVEMISGGAGYTEDPVIQFAVASGQEGEGAKAKALFSSFSLTGFSVLLGGTGYDSAPDVTVTSVVGGAGASGTAVLSTTSVVDSVALTFHGLGYTSSPTVTITGGGGTGAAAVAFLSGTQLTGVEIIENRTPYSTPPTTHIQGGGGQGAGALAHLTAFEVAKLGSDGILIGVTNEKPPHGYHIYDGVLVPGIGYTPVGGQGGGYYGGTTPPPSSDQPVYALDHFDITSVGAGYTFAPDVTLSGGLITQVGVPYAVKVTIGDRGPTSGEYIPSAIQQGFTAVGVADENKTLDLDELENHTYHSGLALKPGAAANAGSTPNSESSKYIDSNFESFLFSGWEAVEPHRLFFDYHNFRAHMAVRGDDGFANPSTYHANFGPPLSGLLEHGVPAYGANDFEELGPGNLFYSENVSTNRLWRLKFHKDSALEQNIQIDGGGGQDMVGYVELKNHNELLGFNDDDSLLDKLFQLYSHPDFRSSAGSVNALDLNDISYEELLWSTPVNKGGKLPNEDAILIPYKLHITGAGWGYTEAPTITEEFDRTFPGMMYMLEPTGITIVSGAAGAHTDLWDFGLEGAPLTDLENHGWERLWGSGYLDGGYSAPQGSCASSATGVAYSSSEYDYNTNTYTYSSGFYLANQYLSDSNKLKIPHPDLGPASAGNGAGGVGEGHPVWNNTKIVGGDIPLSVNAYASGRNYAQNQIIWFSGVNDGGVGPTEIAWGTLNVDHGHDFYGNHSNGHAGVTSITIHNEGAGYIIPDNLPASGGSTAADGSALTGPGGVPGGVVGIITDVISGGEQGNQANGGTSFYAQGNVWPGMDHGPICGYLGADFCYVSTSLPAQGWGMGSGNRIWGTHGLFGYQHHPDEEYNTSMASGWVQVWNGGLLSNGASAFATIQGRYGGYTGQQHARMHEQLEFYAPALELTKSHTNDMYSATSADRINFENQLAKWINFETFLPAQSTVEAFLASGSLDKVEVTDMGSGYTSVPGVVFSGGTSGVEATGAAHTSRYVDSITLIAGGAGYQSFPDVTISGGNGFGASAVGQKAASDITGLSLISGGKDYTESPTINVLGGGLGVTSAAAIKCRLPVALGTLAFTNNKNYKEYRMVGQGDDALKTSQVNELELYSGDYRISNYSNRNNHTLVIKSDKSLLGWGESVNGQLPSSGITNAISVSAGYNHSLIAKENGTVVAFGDNSYGQINVPDDLSNVINVSAGDNHSMALLAGGMVRAWGDNTYGQCSVPASLLSGLSGDHGAIAVEAGNRHSLALLGNGTVLGWGATEPSTVPSALDKVDSVAAGNNFSLALRTNGDVVSWGGTANSYGQLVPEDLKDVVAIDACNDHVLALQVDGSVTGWGRIFDGENNIDITGAIPQGLNSGINIFAGKNHGSILRSDGSMVTFGVICSDELYNSGIIPPNVTERTCCETTGSVIFDLGQTNSDKLNTNEKIAYRSKNITNRLTSDTYFPPDSGYLQNKVRIVMDTSKVGYADAEPITGEYPLIELAPEVSPETNTNYGPSITVSNWDQDSADSLYVRYTLDGSDPATGAGTINEVILPPESGDFIHILTTGEFTNSTTLKVFASSDVYLNSDIVSYVRQQLAAPTATITANGNILNITMSATVPAGETRTPTIYYTLDGSAPTENSYLYANPISLQGSTATVKAKAFLIGYIDSNITIETYP
jgi:alpha-tubulin suppressor-like RCC1 family protein